MHPIRSFGMLRVPQRPAAADVWNLGEILSARRRCGGPFERPGVPGIVARRAPEKQAHREIAQNSRMPNTRIAGADGGNEVQRAEPRQIRISVNAAPHAQQPEKMLHEKRRVEAERRSARSSSGPAFHPSFARSFSGTSNGRAASSANTVPPNST